MKKILSYLLLVGSILPTLLEAGPQRAGIRFTEIPYWEDSVRIAVVRNIAKGTGAAGWCFDPNPYGVAFPPPTCPMGTHNVDSVMQDYVLEALDPSDIPNIAVATSDTVTWSSVEGWWPGRLPHVIVHLNAGFYSCNGDSMTAVLAKAADSAIGIVSIGDDAAHYSNEFFGFDSVENIVGPQGRGLSPNIDLWIRLDGVNDTLQNPGVIRNAVNHYLGSPPRLYFKNYAVNGRCEADADVYEVGPDYLDRITYLGFQEGDSAGTPINHPNWDPASVYNSIIALQDEQRRAVIFSFQPQYLVEEQAIAQILYDGILYASFAHRYLRDIRQFTIVR